MVPLLSLGSVAAIDAGIRLALTRAFFYIDVRYLPLMISPLNHRGRGENRVAWSLVNTIGGVGGADGVEAPTAQLRSASRRCPIRR